MTRVAVVTGAAGGIGAAVVDALADDGFTVAALDVRQGQTRSAVAWYTCDITDPADIRRVATQLQGDLGDARALVNVAGILRSAPVLELDAEDWSTTLEVNLMGAVRTTQVFAPGMVDRGRGVIVNVASNAARIARSGMAAYSASKAALRSYTYALGLELGPAGVRAVVVEPGSTATSMLQGLWPAGQAERGAVAGDGGQFRTGIPLGRVATAADIGDAVAFLVSDRARHITLTSLVVDGGATLGA